MTDAPDILWADWTPVDEIDLPTALSAYTPKARQAPNFTRVEYIRLDLHEAAVAAARAEAAWNTAKALRTWVSEQQSNVLECMDLQANEENAALIWLSNFYKAIDAAVEASK